MGLERMAAVLQGKVTNYDTDLIRPIIDTPDSSSATSDGARPDRCFAAHYRRPCARDRVPDHDGVMPSNEGAGYVLRKIMRRAVRNVRYDRGGRVRSCTRLRARGRVDARAYPEMLESTWRVPV